MTNNKRTSLRYGVLCLGLGSIWLLHTMEKLPWQLDNYLFSWRFLLVVIGLFIMAKNSRSVFGLLVLATGAVASVAHFWHLPYGWEDFLPPVVLMVVGFILILRPSKERLKMDASDANVLNRATVFGSFNYSATSVLFKGGFLTSIFGNNRVDFTNAHLGADNVNLECTNVFGNTVLIVPENWEVKLNTTNILGSSNDMRFIQAVVGEKEGVLTITGLTLFGNLKLKN